MPNYTSFLQTCRDLQKQQGSAHLRKMFLLVEMKPLTVIWSLGPYTSWAALLKGENLCAIGEFNNFELAAKLLKRPTIEAIGVEAAITLAKVEAPLRKQALCRIEEYITQFSTPPRRQVIMHWVKIMRNAPVVPTGTTRDLRYYAKH